VEKPGFTTQVMRIRLRLVIVAKCRSGNKDRIERMKALAEKVGVWTNPSTLELDLLAYTDQLEKPDVRPLLEWVKAHDEKDIWGMPKTLPQFQLELV